MESFEDRTKLRALVIHGSGDKAESILRGRATAAWILKDVVSRATTERLNDDLVMIFSGSRTMGPENPSEAEIMYDTFAKRVRILLSERARARYPIYGNEDIPFRTPDKKDWTIRIGDREISVFLEDESVDTEDNAEKSVRILERLVQEKVHRQVSITPFSSQFHKERIGQAFERYKKNPSWTIAPEAAEDVIAWPGGRYQKYAKAKREISLFRGDLLELAKRLRRKIEGKPPRNRPLVGMVTRIQEILLRMISKTKTGRKAIRKRTRMRVE